MKEVELDWAIVLFYLNDHGFQLARLRVDTGALSLYPYSFPYWEQKMTENKKIDQFLIDKISVIVNKNFQFLGKIAIATWFDIDIKRGSYSWYIGGESYKGKFEV